MNFKIHQARVSAAAADHCSRGPRQTTRSLLLNTHRQNDAPRNKGIFYKVWKIEMEYFSQSDCRFTPGLLLVVSTTLAPRPSPRPRHLPVVACRSSPAGRRRARRPHLRRAMHAAIVCRHPITPNTKWPQRAARPSVAQTAARSPFPLYVPTRNQGLRRSLSAACAASATHCASVNVAQLRPPRPPPTVPVSMSPKNLRRPGPAICASARVRDTGHRPPPAALRPPLATCVALHATMLAKACQPPFAAHFTLPLPTVPRLLPATRFPLLTVCPLPAAPGAPRSLPAFSRSLPASRCLHHARAHFRLLAACFSPPAAARTCGSHSMYRTQERPLIYGRSAYVILCSTSQV
ncbi:hypothetical protein GGX14DRAFT_577055 [Mycena pura]|uniref:Uncharacterized protein n=1 Tax=Mycena pura TaxID=153505 RepID=A0AAD6Y2K8_9AGAR|nr:hypothetical protein GGX14DRAFT_577055 [Mycena pura]